jgi:PmbA protein
LTNTNQNGLGEIAEELMAMALKNGASACDVVAVNGQSTNVEARNGALENTERSEGLSVGLRVFIQQSQAMVTASRFSATDRQELVARAIAMAKVAPPDPFAGLVEKELLTDDIADLDICDQALPTTRQLLETALAVEQAGLDVAGVTQSGGGSASARRNEIFLVTSNGFSGSYVRTGFSVSTSMVAGKGTAMARDYDYSAAVHLSDLDKAEKIGRIAGERAVRRLDPRKLDSQKCPVVFDHRVASSLVGHLSSAINGSSISRGTSFLKEAMGTDVFARNINIIDDATLPRGLASKPFDGEGVATSKRAVVKDGAIASWLLDARSAQQLKLKTTGNASRGTSGPPSPSASNLYLQAGAKTPEELMADIGQGFYVTELIGMGVNGVTGDYSRGACGFWIENGQIAYPVNEITIGGNLKDMFAMLEPANDLKFRGATNAPTCLIAEMTLAGK